MKVLSRDFTLKEKLLLLVLVLVLLGLGYYYFVNQPVIRELQSCAAEKSALQTELDSVNMKLAALQKMQSELDAIEARGDASIMKSYNNSKEEIKLLNDVLSQTSSYTVAFANATKDGDQIRRNFTLSFAAPDYEAMADVIAELAKSDLRCMVADISCARGNYSYYLDGGYRVSATATFYETMVGGTPDTVLPNG